jgi:outer membrane protein assembly factor BamB
MKRPPAAVALAASALMAVGCASLRGGATSAPQGELSGQQVLTARWRRLLTEAPLIEYKPQEFAAAASGARKVFVGSHGGWFYALRQYDGGLVWRKRIPAGVSSRPLYLADSATVYVGGDDGVLYALDGETGKERWTYKTKGQIGGAPVYDEGMIYFTTGENRLYAVDAHSGAWRWQYEREVPEAPFTIRGVSSPLVVRGRVYAGFADGYLAVLNARTGDVVWARSLAGDAQRFVDVDATPSLVAGVLYVSSYSGGVYAIDPADGTMKWRYEAEGAKSVWVERGRVYFASTRSGIHCLDLQGHLVWRQLLADAGELSSPLVLGGRYLVVSAAERGTYVVDARSGQLVQFFSPGHGVTSDPTTDGSQVYVLTNAGFLYAFAIG